MRVFGRIVAEAASMATVSLIIQIDSRSGKHIRNVITHLDILDTPLSGCVNTCYLKHLRGAHIHNFKRRAIFRWITGRNG
jgi:hypothetical protein